MLVTSEAPGTGATHVTIVTTVNTRHPAHRGQLLLYPGLCSESLYWPWVHRSLVIIQVQELCLHHASHIKHYSHEAMTLQAESDK